MHEIWVKVEGSDNRYEVSDLGNVRTWITSGRITKRLKTPRLLSPHYNKNRGYYYVSLAMPNKRKNFILHRLVASHFMDNPDNLPVVNHLDCDRANNEVLNLEWCTHKENSAHAKKMGRMPNYDYRIHKNVILTPEIAESIRAEYKSGGTTYNKLGAKFGVKYSTVAHIMRGSRWSNKNQ